MRETGAGDSLDELAALSCDVFVFGGVDGVVGFRRLIPLDSPLDHLVDRQSIPGDDLAEVADSVRGDDVVPLRQAAFEQPVIARAPIAAVFWASSNAVEQLAVIDRRRAGLSGRA